jgi:NTP pyrophosphatase (non-canonical NTP hydrolase)
VKRSNTADCKSVGSAFVGSNPTPCTIRLILKSTSYEVLFVCYSKVMNIDDLQKRAIEIRNKYDKLNQEQRGVTWNEQQLMAGFVGDVGDLSKIIMAKHGLREMEDVDEKLAHELSDCLWSVLVLADKYKIDLSKEFMKTMDDLDKRIDSNLATS